MRPCRLRKWSRGSRNCHSFTRIASDISSPIQMIFVHLLYEMCIYIYIHNIYNGLSISFSTDDHFISCSLAFFCFGSHGSHRPRETHSEACFEVGHLGLLPLGVALITFFGDVKTSPLPAPWKPRKPWRMVKAMIKEIATLGVNESFVSLPFGWWPTVCHGIDGSFIEVYLLIAWWFSMAMLK